MKKLTDKKGSASLEDIMSQQGAKVLGEENITSKGNLKGVAKDEEELQSNIDGHRRQPKERFSFLQAALHTKDAESLETAKLRMKEDGIKDFTSVISTQLFCINAAIYGKCTPVDCKKTHTCPYCGGSSKTKWGTSCVQNHLKMGRENNYYNNGGGSRRERQIYLPIYKQLWL